MEIRSEKNKSQVNKKFTDREKLRKSFWDCYKKLEAELPKDKNVHVLAYYGIGGIGKTSLVKQLMREFCELEKKYHYVYPNSDTGSSRNKEKKHYYIYHDLAVSSDTRSVLESIRNKLAKEYDFVFPRLDLALCCYAVKCGENINIREVKSWAERSRFLDALFQASELMPFLWKTIELAGIITGVDMFVKLVKFLDKAVACFKQYREDKQIKDELRAISSAEPAQLLANLPNYFADDVTANLAGKHTPLVIFLDTYEQLVNELSGVGDPTARDIWLRGYAGIIRKIPGILWVITGREKLRWEKYDADWQKDLEQHSLDDFSSKDADEFLTEAGIDDKKLRQEIYGLTHGTPVYLDLCVDTYYRLKERKKEAKIEAFGNKPQELIERFIRYMDDSKKDMVYLLAVMGSWNDAMMDRIGGQVLQGYSFTAYEHAKELSFVTCDGEGNYFLHKTVEEVLCKECPKRMYEKVLAAVHEYYQADLAKKAVTSSDYAVKLKKYCEFVLTRCGVAECKKCYKETISDYVRKMAEFSQWEEAEEIVNLFWNVKDMAEDREMQISVCSDLGMIYGQAGKYAKACEYNEKAYQNSFDVYGAEHLDTLDAMNNMANSYSFMKEYAKALELQEKVLTEYKKIFGAAHPKTLDVMNNMANTYRNMKEYAKAIELQKEVLAKRKEVQGEWHPATLRAMNNLALSYSFMKEYTKAIELFEEVLAKRKEILGEEHPYTLNTMNNLANSYSSSGEYDKALELQKEVLVRRKEKLGAAHSDTLKAMKNLAKIYGLLQKELNRQIAEIRGVRNKE